MTSRPAAPPDAELLGAARSLAAQAGFPGDWALTRLEGGANNRVYRMSSGGASLLLKAYFKHEGDPRDRLGAEYAFSRFAWDRGLRCLPRPLGADAERRLALYEFIDGRRLETGEVGRPEVAQALEFYETLNAHRGDPAASALPSGSEARFSVAGHLDLVGKRVAALATAAEDEARAFAREELAPAWAEASAAVKRRAEAELPAASRCLSPSDFGFHNALLAADGRLRFFDFEYAGWDDPARLVCDFFCQPAVRAPLEHLPFFTEGTGRTLPEPGLHAERVRLLLPLYRLKWVCIMLNDFLPVGGSRRAFGGDAATLAARKAAQLAKARLALSEARELP